MRVKVVAAQSCPSLCNPVDCGPPGSSVHGIPQARVLEWGAIPFSRGSSQPRDWTQISCIAGRLGMDFIKIIIQQEGYIQYNTWMKTSFQLIWAINFLIFFFWMKKANHYSFSALESWNRLIFYSVLSFEEHLPQVLKVLLFRETLTCYRNPNDRF